MRTTSLLAAAFIALMATASAASAQVTIKSAQVKSDPVKSETLKFEAFKGELALPASGRLYTGRSSYRDTGHGAYRGKNGHIGFARGVTGVAAGQGRYADLVGDSESGLGFYQLPEPYRAGAERYRWTHRPYGPYGNPVQQAVIDDAVRTGAFTPTSAVNGYRYGVYDPIDGVGTPFFAGYYSAGTRDASDGPEPIFGNPLD
jgi:hypothetical protein